MAIDEKCTTKRSDGEQVIPGSSDRETRTGRSRTVARTIVLGAAIFLAALGAAVPGFGLGSRFAASARATEARVRAAAAETLLERDARVAADRPVLHGEPVPGRAFERYDAALKIAARNRSDEHDLAALFHGRELDPSRAAQLRADWWPAVAEMRAGARRSDARRPMVDGALERAASFYDARWVVNMAVVQVREAVARDEPLEAVRVSLDAATFGIDIARSPLVLEQLFGSALVAIATADSWTEERLARLDHESLDLLATGLARLDAMLPHALRVEFVVLHHAAVLDGRMHDSWVLEADGSLADRWRYGLSTRWMLADAVCEFADLAEDKRRLADRPWPERDAAMQRLAERAATSPNPIVRTQSMLFSANRAHACAVALVRTLRMSVDVHRGRADDVRRTPLADPLTDGPITVVAQDDALLVHSTLPHAQRTVALPSPR